MCRICVEWELGKLTSEEALRAAGEVLSYSDDNRELDHATNVVEKILEQEMPENESDPETDELWSNETYRKE